jgi:hypothetical protein
MRNIFIIGEMLRMLGDAAVRAPVTVERPELAAALIRTPAVSRSAFGQGGACDPEMRRQCERLAIVLFFSVWFGRLLQAIELEDGSVVYRLTRGHCGDFQCCGPDPLLAERVLD